MPYGTVLIISPFNFPVLLSLGVLTAAIAGGNTAVLKVSAKAPASAEAVAALIADTFPPEYVTVVRGGHDTADLLLAERFDKIFYTGSPRVAKGSLTGSFQAIVPLDSVKQGDSVLLLLKRVDGIYVISSRSSVFSPDSEEAAQIRELLK